MRLAHPNFMSFVDIGNTKLTILYIENPKFLRKLIFDFINEDNFILSQELEILNIQKYVSITTDILSLQPSQRKIEAAIFNRLKEAMFEDFYTQSLEITDSLNKFANLLINSQNFPLDFELDTQALLKILNIKPQKCETLLENILSFTLLSREFLKTKLFVFVGLRAYLDDDEMSLLFKEIRLKELNILLIEPNFRKKLDFENSIIVDYDLCEVRF